MVRLASPSPFWAQKLLAHQKNYCGVFLPRHFPPPFSRCSSRIWFRFTPHRSHINIPFPPFPLTQIKTGILQLVLPTYLPL